LRTSDFDYPLPKDLIAQTPMEPRDASRLMRLDKCTGHISHHRFHELPALLRPGDLLVLNDSRVIPARLLGRRVPSGGQVELLLLRREQPGLWQCLGRPGRSLQPGQQVTFAEGLAARVVECGDGGLLWVELSDESLIERVGQAPLPPYIQTPLQDPERYQTVYADKAKAGSAAAPTAGLHFTPELLARLRQAGIELAYVTLHVGLDTFRPVEEADPREHKLHTEFWELPAATAQALNAARGEGRRIVAVGTTTVRTLEQAALLAQQAGDGEIKAGAGWADLFILPGHAFRVVEAMVTNFHLPRSSLLMLVSAFAGRERILHAYQVAAQERYRFYTFGDPMLIV
jgi:S-adenosylmethionine:tRNA ribosyltransferase-isomerase